MDQASLWQRFKKGDKNSLKTIYEEHIDALFLFGKKLCTDDEQVWDYIHDLFVYVWESREKLGDPVVIRAYLLKSLRNRIIDDFRKNKKVNLNADISMVRDTDMSREDEWVAFETSTQQSEKLGLALKALTDRQREVIYLKFNQNMSYEEIGDILGINYQSIRNLAHRAITELRKNMVVLLLILSGVWIFSVHL